MNWELVNKDKAIIKGNISHSTQMISAVLQAGLLVTFLVDTFINDVYEENQHVDGFARLILPWELLQVGVSNITVIT